MNYLFGEEIEYSFELLKPEDITILQAFSCGNTQMDYTIHNELIKNGRINSDDGIPFKVWNKETQELYAIASLATANYIVLYADKSAKHFYERNLFEDFSEFMEKEQNMEINMNDPMFLRL